MDTPKIIKKRLDHLHEYFFAGTAEDEIEQLSEIFVSDPELRLRLRDPRNRFHVIIGVKGVGKSALLHDEHRYAKSVGVSVFLKPDDISVPFDKSEGALASIKRKLFAALMGAAAAELGEQLGGKLTDYTDQVLRSEALREGSATPDFIERLSALLANTTKLTDKVDLSKALAGDNPSRSINTLYRAVSKHLDSNDTPLSIFIDDTDQIASPDEEDQLNRIWGVILAAREMTLKLKKARVLISLRSNIWARLKTAQRGQLDQIDHINPHITVLDCDERMLEQIFLRRIDAGARLAREGGIDCPGKSGLVCFFESRQVSLPEASEQQRSWAGFISKVARNRPRDLIQFVAKLIDKSREKDIISQTVVESAMQEYSNERVDYLNAEFGLEFQPLTNMVKSLSKLPVDEVEFELLRTRLESIPAEFSVTVRGRTLHPGRKESTVDLLAAFFEIGILNARIVDKTKSKGYDHKTFQRFPNLVSNANWNEIQGYRWEVHPAYRSYLHALRRERERATNIKVKFPPKPRHDR